MNAEQHETHQAIEIGKQCCRHIHGCDKCVYYLRYTPDRPDIEPELIVKLCPEAKAILMDLFN
jgi:hypothetical protein